MPPALYIVPMVAGPYGRSNPQRPDYVDEIRCNWTGHNVDAYGVYICKVNTTDTKHADLASRAGVRQLPRTANWSTVISTLSAAAQTAISNWCSSKDIPFDSSDTIGELLCRVLAAGVLTFGNRALSTQYQDLTQQQKDRVVSYCQKWGLPVPSGTDTVSQTGRRIGRALWPGDDESKVAVTEF